MGEKFEKHPFSITLFLWAKNLTGNRTTRILDITATNLSMKSFTAKIHKRSVKDPTPPLNGRNTALQQQQKENFARNCLKLQVTQNLRPILQKIFNALHFFIFTKFEGLFKLLEKIGTLANFWEFVQYFGTLANFWGFAQYFGTLGNFWEFAQYFETLANFWEFAQYFGTLGQYFGSLAKKLGPWPIFWEFEQFLGDCPIFWEFG